MTLHQLYEVLKNSVAVHPYINTFCVINEPNDITIDNLKKTIHDKYKPFFYSKNWAESNYDPDEVNWLGPALFVYEKPFLVKGLFSGLDKIEYNLQFLLLMDDHIHQTTTELLTDGQRLEPAEIFHRTRSYLLNVLNFTYATYTKIRDLNKEIVFTQWQSSSMKMSGVSADIKFIEDCIEHEKYWEGDFTVPEEPSGHIGYIGICKRYIKIVNNVMTVSIPYSEHLLNCISGANIYDSSGNEVEALVNIDTVSNNINIESNILFSNHKIVIH